MNHCCHLNWLTTYIGGRSERLCLSCGMKSENASWRRPKWVSAEDFDASGKGLAGAPSSAGATLILGKDD